MFVGTETSHVMLRDIVKRSSIGENEKSFNLDSLSRQGAMGEQKPYATQDSIVGNHKPISQFLADGSCDRVATWGLDMISPSTVNNRYKY